MRIVAEIVMLLGGVIAVLAGVGVLRFDNTYARFHAAGKASPVAFLTAAAGAAPLVGWTGAAYLGVGVVAMVLTLPLGVHLLFRAVHRTDPELRPATDELAPAEAARGSADQLP